MSDYEKRTLKGLSPKDVEERIQNGDVNISESGLTPGYKEIVIKNTITLFNIINTVLLIALILVGHIENTLFYGIVICNIAMGIIQEVRAKKNFGQIVHPGSS